MSDYLLYSILFLAIPAIVIVLFGVSLYRYISAKKRNKNAPGTFPPEEIKKRKIFLIITSVILGVFVVVVIGFMALLFLAIAFM